MEVEALKLYLQNIEEYVMDEDKIVTYKWLSKNLDIHVNTAKQLLYTFATEQKNNVHLTYLVGGVLCDGTGCKILIVPEEELIKAKAEFKTLTSHHVYSVQKANALPDLETLYAVDKHKRDETDVCKRLSAITCSKSVLRPREEIERLRLKARTVTSTVDGKQLPRGLPANKKTAETPSNKETAAAADMAKVDHGTKKDLKHGGIAAMFAAQTSKIKQHDDMDKKPKAAQKSLAESKASSSISKFLSRETEKTGKPKISAAKDSQDDGQSPHGAHGNLVEENCTSKGHQEKQDIPHKKTDLSSTVKNNSIKHTSNKARNGKSKKISTSGKLVPAKKPKRIVVFSDSEDSSDDDIIVRDDRDVCESPPPPEMAPKHESDGDDIIPPTPEADLKKGRKRVRKMKDKTYMDEDGYMLTRKEYVIESCTDSEGEQNNENENKQLNKNDDCIKTEESKTARTVCKEPPTKKKALLQKTKQATIMNFFKKSC